jgi:hypothetical protein
MLPSWLPEYIADEEDLARFLTSSSQFNATMVKPAAFLPNPKDHKKSVFRHGAEPRASLLRLAQDRISPNLTVQGAAICKAAVVRLAKLDAIPEEPPPLHANIVGWPINANDPDLQKAEEKERAALIASKGALVRFESKP